MSYEIKGIQETIERNSYVKWKIKASENVLKRNGTNLLL